MVLVKDVMNEFVSIIEKKCSILEAAKKMKVKGFSCLVVYENEQIIGIVTRRDILEKVVSMAKDPSKVNVKRIMSSPVITITKNKTLVQAAQIMKKDLIKQLPVVDNQDKLIGILTQTDILRNLSKILNMK